MLRNTPPGVLLGVGVFLGLLVGIVGTVAFLTPDTGETFEEYEGRTRGPSRPAQPARGVSDPHATAQPRNPHGEGGANDPRLSFAKVHFMKKFVAALTETPDNMAPNTSYEPLLKDGAKPISCTDCHNPETLNIPGMLQRDPGSEAVEPLRRDPRFMIPLMQKWVQRLNAQHADRLRKPVTCTDCHAIDPRDMGKRVRVYPALMVSFVNALKKPPTNEDPAPDWQPLLKDPGTESMLCANCHEGPTGKTLEENLDRFDLSRPDEFADDKQFMIHLMERWVTRLNTKLRGRLTKAVSCRDCHAKDPRR